LRRFLSADPDARTGLWLHSEDLSPETMIWPCRIHAIAAVDAIGGDPADIKRAHANAALADGVARAEQHWQCPAIRLPGGHGMRDARLGRGQKPCQIVTPYAPVGPVADRVAAVGAALAKAGIALVRQRRDWDSAAWPHATRGFFQFKGHIPGLLA
jgi:deoxyribodipyrimidine photo-lyase